jgi:FkbM family methyltransferase
VTIETTTMTLISTLRFVLRHPLNRDRPLAALVRYARWQVGSRLLPGEVAVPFVESTRLLVKAGMTGATQNVYCGLHEFEEMALILHALRPGDLFVDVGANVGSYTVLAAGAAGADCIAFEPVPRTFAHLQANIRINGLESKVTACNIGIAATRNILAFTSSLDTVNHVVGNGESGTEREFVSVEPLDESLATRDSPTFLKIDVEGFETEVIGGALQTLKSPRLLGVILELNGSGSQYGHDDASLHRKMLEFGFETVRYDPFTRTLRDGNPPWNVNGNRIYCRDREALCARLRSAPRFAVHGKSI